jgi:hypothetical protein
MQNPDQSADTRREYEPPAIEETSAFETLALNCTHNASSQCESYYYPGGENSGS